MIDEEQIYRQYSVYLKKVYGEKVYKLPINLDVSCPNRLDGMGCTFCSDLGTGFEAVSSTKSVTRQLLIDREHIEKKYNVHKFIAYFQNYTNTFMPLDDFKRYIEEAAQVDGIVEIAVSTRPDCIHISQLDYLEEIRRKYNINISIELGLQTVNYKTLMKINRGHTLAEYIEAVMMITKYNFNICTHLILNLPYDDMDDIIETAKIISALKIHSVKLHSLYLAKGTKMADDYLDNKIKLCTKDEYIERLISFLAYLDKDVVIERLFSRIPEENCIFSNWGCSWWKLKEEFLNEMAKRNMVQGCKCNYLGGSGLQKGGFDYGG